MAYRTLDSVLHPDGYLALPIEAVPQRPVRVMVTILEDAETNNHAADLDPEHKQ